VLRDYGPQSIGKTERCAYQKAIKAAEQFAEEYNNSRTVADASADHRDAAVCWSARRLCRDHGFICGSLGSGFAGTLDEAINGEGNSPT
jgi:hypothetical protein